MNLELMAMRWLRWEKRCEFVMLERCPRGSCGEPDVIGITRSRYMTEIEIKRSMSDFRADAHKPHRNMWSINPAPLPKQIYYLAPSELAKKLIPLVPTWAGLMAGPTGDDFNLRVLKTAPVNQLSRRLTIKECCRILHLMSNHAISVFEQRQSAIDRFVRGGWQWPEPDFEI